MPDSAIDCVHLPAEQIEIAKSATFQVEGNVLRSHMEDLILQRDSGDTW